MGWAYQPLLPAAAQIQAGGGGGGFTLTADEGSFGLTGEAAGFLRSLRLGAGQGSFTLTGEAASFVKALRLAAAQGGFVLSGEDASFLKALRLAAAQGGFVLSGEAASLLASRLLTAADGNFALSGEGAVFSVTNLFVAGEGGFALSGQSAGFLRALRLVAARGAFALAGEDAGLLTTGNFIGGEGGFTLSGEAIGFILSRVIGAGVGAFALSAPLADFRKLGPVQTAPTTRLAVQRGILERATAALAFYPASVYDHVPHDKLMPFVSMDEHQTLDNSGAGIDGFNHVFYLSIWSQYRGRKEVEVLLDALWRALHNQKLRLENGAIIACYVSEKNARLDADGLSMQGTLVAKVFTNPY